MNHIHHVPTLGQRIRRFRELRELTQQVLEFDLDMSFGHISRIESGHVNPGKETLMRMAKVLELRTCELNYFLGVTAEPASQEEIDAAIAEVQPYFQKKGVVAYLLDERWRYVLMSNSFVKLFIGTTQAALVLPYIIGMPSPQVLLDEKSNAKNTFTPESHEQVVKTLLPYYYSQTYFMIGDQFFLNTSRIVKELPLYKDFWIELEKKKTSISFIPQDKRVELFLLHGKTIHSQFAREPLMTNSRFEMHEYRFSEQDLKQLDKAGLL